MGFFYTRQKRRGFTLVEVLVVVGVLAGLSSIVYFNGGEARKKSRDTQRVSDIQQIVVALRLYKELNGTYPDCEAGMIIGEKVTPNKFCKNNIDTILTPYLTKIPNDPLGGASYHYVYDSDMDCRANGNGSNETVLYVTKTENPAKANWGSNSGSIDGVCEPTGASTEAEAYGVVLGPSVP